MIGFAVYIQKTLLLRRSWKVLNACGLSLVRRRIDDKERRFEARKGK
jgi:hypothetical protein